MVGWCASFRWEELARVRKRHSATRIFYDFLPTGNPASNLRTKAGNPRFNTKTKPDPKQKPKRETEKNSKNFADLLLIGNVLLIVNLRADLIPTQTGALAHRLVTAHRNGMRRSGDEPISFRMVLARLSSDFPTTGNLLPSSNWVGFRGATFPIPDAIGQDSEGGCYSTSESALL